MGPSRLCLAATVVLAAGAAVLAQQTGPRIGYIYPAGGRQGEKIEVTVGGQFLEGVNNAYVSGTGVTATVIEHTKPMTVKEASELRDRLQELLKQPKTADVLKAIAEIRQKLSTFTRNITPAIAETVRVQITLAADAEPGIRELRLATRAGLTNPRWFCVGGLPEYSEKPAKPPPEPRPLRDGRLGSPPPPQPSETEVVLPAVINGQITPGGVDRYRFKALKGQRLVFAVAARQLIPYLADAVPGWFQAAITLYDADGKELAYADHYLFHPDPVLEFDVPRDGQYVLEVRDSIYRGREDFVYRISAGELPFITGIFPLGGPAGQKTRLEVAGWNLPTGALEFDATGKLPGAYGIVVRSGQCTSNEVPFAVDALPERVEKEPNDLPQTAQAVIPPVIVNGRIDRPGQWDVYRIEARKGDEIVAEVYARRLDSPLDSLLRLTDASGRQLAANDDHEDKASGLNTHHADSYLRVKLPEAGTYYVHVGDTQNQGGPQYAYRLRISPPMPDFQLRVVPSSVNVRANATTAITVYALRKDGFSDDISLALKDAPPGFSLAGAVLPAGQDQVRLTLTAPLVAPKEPVRLAIEGRARIGGQDVVRQAVPAEDMMQAFAYRHLVPVKELDVAVSSRFPGRAVPRILGSTPVRIPVGKTAAVRFDMPMNTLLGTIQLELSDPPEGITIQKVSPILGGTEIVLQSDAAKVKPGLRGNLIVAVYLAERPKADADKPAAQPRRRPAGTLPAIPFEVVHPQ